MVKNWKNYTVQTWNENEFDYKLYYVIDFSKKDKINYKKRFSGLNSKTLKKNIVITNDSR